MMRAGPGRNALLAPAGLVLALLTGLAGCAGAPPAPERFDFGLPAVDAGAGAAAAADAGPGIAQASVGAPAWLDTPALFYRLAYADAGQVHAYAQRQWAAPPAALLEQRLRESLAAHRGAGGAGTGLSGSLRLRVELDEFSQVFATASASHAQLRARVELVQMHTNAVLAQRRFVLEAPCPSADAAGALQGLRVAADRFIAQALDWAAQLPAPAAPMNSTSQALGSKP